jgi:UDP-N-acetylmuramate: L-alanyl-gamma-D-glutamyl-meso-diaminopimelate ligase
MNLIPANGRLILGWDSEVVREVENEMGGRLYTLIETYGIYEDAKWQARDLDFSGELTKFSVYKEGEEWGKFETPLIGDFNVRNCLAVIIAADAWGVALEKIQEALRTFKSVKRRAEIRGTERGVTVIDDFAHHPTAVEETLKALRTKYAGRRLIAVFEPRSWSSRLAVFQQQYARAFGYADYVIIAGVYDTSKAGALGAVLDTEQLVADIVAKEKTALSLPDADAIVAYLTPELKEGDVVAIMSNGGFGGIHDKILNVLKND